jgi:hypothetical protein
MTDGKMRKEFWTGRRALLLLAALTGILGSCDCGEAPPDFPNDGSVCTVYADGRLTADLAKFQV